MDFAQTESQVMIAKQAREILGTESPTRVIRLLVEKDKDGYDRNLWKKMADAGWLGVATPREYGGESGDLSDLYIICEQMGYFGLVGPFFTSAILATQALLIGGNESQKKEHLPGIAKGESIVSWAVQESNVENELRLIKTTATPAGSDYMLDGTKLFVPYAQVAKYLLVLARIKGSKSGQGLTLFIVDANAPGITKELVSTMGLDRQFAVNLKKVKVGGENVLGEVGGAAEVVNQTLKVVTIAKMYEMLGGLARALEMTVDYAKTRCTWGQPIGTRQAIQHHLADVFVDLNLCRVLINKAAWALKTGQPADMEISMAKSFINEKYRIATKTGLQTHGTIAFCIDHDMSVFIKQSKAAAANFGSTDYHLSRVAEGMGL